MDEGAKDRGCRCLIRKPFHWCPAILLVASFLGCGGVVGSGPPQPPPPPPPAITVSVTPTSASVLIGEPKNFAATVGNSENKSVVWSVNDVPGGNSTFGTVDANGVYLSPGILPLSGNVTVRASSVADPSKNASASVHISSDISVSSLPQGISVELGSSKSLSATVTSAGLPNLGVLWSVSGPGCAGSVCGIVDNFGNYTAPQNLPAIPNVSLTAISVADPTRTSSTTLTITSSFTVSLNGPNPVYTGTVVNYTGAVTPVSNSNPNRTVLWGVSGMGCSGAACGTISSSGVYTAPALPPAPAMVQVTATPTADQSKAVSISVAIIQTLTVVVSPATTTLAPMSIQAFHAQVSGAQNATVTWDVNGVVGGNSVYGTILNSQTDPNNTTYTAPPSIPQFGSVTVRATSNENPNVSAYAIVTYAAGISVALTPSSATRTIGHRQSFAAQVNYSSNQNISWSVAGIPGGNASVGQICAAGSTPCNPVSLDNSGSVDFLAPAGIPFPNPVTVTATSQVDGTTNSSATVTILPHLVVSLIPGNAALANGSRQQFAAVVLGSDNQQVIWKISGGSCGTPPACGAIDSSGLYTAPTAAPKPNLINVVASSSEDSTQSATATVTISGGPNIALLAPSSAYAGSAGNFTLEISGNNYVPSTPGPGSTILVAGTPRTTSCASITQCTTSLSAADLQIAGNISIRAQNPGGTVSNTANFVVLSTGFGAGTIALTPGAPSAIGKDIVVVELSTNGGADTSGSVSLNIAAIGAYTVFSNSCVLGDSPMILLRPGVGVSTADLCVFSISGLDPSFTYTISGPPVPDIVIINRAPLGFGILHLTLQIPATAVAGPRTLFVQNPDKDMAAGTGALEVR
jgi:hypothetical protein